MRRRAPSKLLAHPFLPLAALVLLINFLTMPAEFYRGDPHSIRMSSLQLIKNGRIGIPEDKAPTLGTMIEPEGKYFFHNKERRTYFSKYGVFTSLLFAPPLIAEDLLHGVENFYDYDRPTANQSLPFYTRSLILTLNIYNILLSLGIAYYFFQITGFFSRRLISRYVFVLSVFYATFLWNYLRAQSTEIFQVLFFAGFFYHFTRFCRSDKSKPDWGNLSAAMLFATALAFTKQYFFLLFPIALFAAWRSIGPKGDLKIIQFMITTMAAAVLIALLLNALQFGSPFEVGYSQWLAADGRPNDRFSPSNVPAALIGFLSRMDRSILLHFPPLAFSFFGIVAFARRNRFELAFAYAIFGVFLLFIAHFSNWSGDWCYGPRYLLFILPVISMPLLPVFDWICEQAKSAAAIAAGVLILAVLLVSAKLQINLNSLPFFSVYELSSHYAGFRSEDTDAYFQNNHFGLICGDLIGHRRRANPFFPLEALRRAAPPDRQPQVEQLHRLQNSADFAPNYYFSGTGE